MNGFNFRQLHLRAFPLAIFRLISINAWSYIFHIYNAAVNFLNAHNFNIKFIDLKTIL